MDSLSSRSSNAVWYVYGIAPAEMPGAALPAGLDDAPVRLEIHGGVAALVSVLGGEDYTPESIDLHSGDVEWLGPRAVAHDRVLTAASDATAVVPLPMFSLFSGRDALHTMLHDRGPQLAATLHRIGPAREYALRVHRVDADVLAVLPELSPRIAKLASSAAAASPGQRYLLERKLEGEKKNEMRAASQRVVDEIMDALSPLVSESARSPIPRTSDATVAATAAAGTMVLNAAFLVAGTSLPGFQRMLTSLVERHSAHGFRFDFTGPWPPYHFVSGRAQ